MIVLPSGDPGTLRAADPVAMMPASGQSARVAWANSHPSRRRARRSLDQSILFCGTASHAGRPTRSCPARVHGCRLHAGRRAHKPHSLADTHPGRARGEALSWEGIPDQSCRRALLLTTATFMPSCAAKPRHSLSCPLITMIASFKNLPFHPLTLPWNPRLRQEPRLMLDSGTKVCWTGGWAAARSSGVGAIALTRSLSSPC